MILGAIGALVAIALVVGGMSVLGGDEPNASATATPSSPPTGAPQVTGEVTPDAMPPEAVACEGEVPPEAGEPKPQFDRAPGADLLEPDVLYVATVETSCGAFEIELEADRAPQTVASFVFLVGEGYFDGLTFHRVVPGFVIQGGDPLGTGTGGPGYALPDELGGRMRYVDGTVAMANSGPDSGGSQWFVVSGPDGANLDDIPNYTIFGKVSEGLEVVRAIQDVPVAGQAPTEAVYIGSITIEERPLPSPEPEPSPDDEQP